MSPPEIPTTAQRAFAGLALTAGVLAGSIAVDIPPGVNVIIVGGLMGAAVLCVVRHQMTPTEWGFGIAGFVLLSMFALRTSEPVLLADLCAAAGLASLAMRGGETWRAILRGGFAVLAKLHRSLVPVLGPIRRSFRPLDRATRAPLLRGSALGLILAVVFGVLFSSADRAFGQIAQDFLIPDWDVGLLPARFMAGLMTICFTGAYALVATTPVVERSGSPWASITGVMKERKHLRTAEWVIPLTLVDLVFFAFVAVQITVLFGGQQHVLETTGLTYAEYARSGFFQLVVIAALVLGVIAAMVNFTKAEASQSRRLMQGLLGVLCVLTLVVLASALKRLGLYEEAYGFTRLRFLVHVTIIWLSGVLVTVMVAGLRWEARWLPRVVVGLTALILLGVNLMNPDGFIARRNIERFEATGKIDVGYLSTLSLDAVPAFTELPPSIGDCLLAGPYRTFEDTPIWSYNLSRERAGTTLAGLTELPKSECFE
ncbi:MAG: DUF4173 domain-containing protein [Actinobacteria bacterium]|nr:DUF4173 domain-containing protein [Actinomycetota bacterium]